MPEAFVTAAAAGGRAFTNPVDGTVWVSPAVVATFAERHHKSLRYLNRGSVVTAALIDAVLAERWPNPDDRPDGLALVVGSAFGNQGETTRYFRSFVASGPGTVTPMASYDVAINAFVNFCSIFFRCTGIVQTLSCGAVSGTDALANGLSLLEVGEATAVIVVGVEHESPETSAYCGASSDTSDSTESGVVLLLESSPAGRAVRGRVIAAETAFAPPSNGRTATVLSALIDRVTSTAGLGLDSVAVVAADPPWTEMAAAARRTIVAPAARWIDTTRVGGRWQIGSAGLIGGALLLDALSGSEKCGLSVAVDPLGWVGAALLAGLPGRTPRGTPTAEGGLTCPP